jgi:DNA-binding beta-propeller fold protein YncE/mono/diheme cytochrome c family protein
MRRGILACLFVGACANAPSARAPSTAVLPGGQSQGPLGPLSCARRTQAVLPARTPDARARQGSAVALVRAGSRLLAYVADADSRSVHTVAIDEGRELVRTRVDGQPRQLVVLADGRVAATLSDGTRVAILEPNADPAEPLVRLCEREVPAEPWGLAVSPDDAKLVVTSAWGSALTVLDASTLDVTRIVPLPRDPRGVLVDEDGVAFIAHLVGAKTSVVDLAKAGDPVTIDLNARKSTPLALLADQLAVRTGAQGYALASVTLPGGTLGRAGESAPRRILFPMVSVDPGDPERQSKTYYGPAFDGVPKEAPTVSAVDPEALKPLSPYVLGTTEAPFARECLLPRAAAVRGSGDSSGRSATLLVACRGIDAVLELDALAVDPFRAERRRFDVPPGPEGIAVDDASGRAVVFSQLAGALTVLALDDPAAKPRTLALDYRPEPALAAAARGRQLFYRTDDTRISGDGIGCSSCHIDGREDGLTWMTPTGPRQTPMLAGRLAGTAPYGWLGDRKTVGDYIVNTVARLGGKGLEERDVEDLMRFLLVLETPPSSSPANAVVQRGRELFDDAAQGCSTCHVGGATDGATHSVAAGAGDPVSSLDTPSLRFIGGTAPYFHDGRYASLEALLTDPASRMGQSASLPWTDRAALAAYLRSL